jgi:hypothetical protein
MGAYRGLVRDSTLRTIRERVGRVKPEIRTSNGGYHSDGEALGCLVGVPQ